MANEIRRWALDASAAVWSSALGWHARARTPSADELGLLEDAIAAAQVSGNVAVVGPWAAAVELPPGTASTVLDGGDSAAPVVLAGGLEACSTRKARRVLTRLASAPLVVTTLPLWPRGIGLRQARTRRWWDARAAEVGLVPALELRRAVGGVEALVYAPRRTVSPPARWAAARPRRDVVVRVNTPLSVGNSFTWIVAGIALALDELGVPVSIARTAISATFDDGRRERLEHLVERRPMVGTPDVEIGWTHYWRGYHHPIGGRVPVTLFAINYAFRRSDPDGFDPWLRGVLAQSRPLAPISNFCREVLVDAGFPAELAHVVPMGYTDGIERALKRPLPGARSFKVLHVTNAADIERNGTDLALAAYEAAFGPDDDVTLVVRDYGSYSPALHTNVSAMAARGYDARYWPVFVAQERLGGLIGAFDVLLAPFRGEGFGIKVLDAMACGVMPIAPAFGGPRDFLGNEVAMEVTHDLVPVTSGYDWQQIALGNEPVWAECGHDALVAALRLAPSVAGARGRAARHRAVGRFSWHDSARRVLELAELEFRL